jgi:hypothetical protein
MKWSAENIVGAPCLALVSSMGLFANPPGILFLETLQIEVHIHDA